MIIKSKSLRLLFFLLVPILFGAVGAWATNSQLDTWYATLAKPGFNPPDSIFAPVWATLYLLMGAAAFLVQETRATTKNKTIKQTAFIWYYLQLGLNTGWSLLFFSAHALGLAAVEILILWLAILLNLIYFAKINRAAAWLLVPYLAWISFAAALSIATWKLN